MLPAASLSVCVSVVVLCSWFVLWFDISFCFSLVSFFARRLIDHIFEFWTFGLVLPLYVCVCVIKTWLWRFPLLLWSSSVCLLVSTWLPAGSDPSPPSAPPCRLPLVVMVLFSSMLTVCADTTSLCACCSRLAAYSSNADSSSADLSSCQLFCRVSLSFFPTQLKSPGWTEATMKGRRRWQRQKGQWRRDLMRRNKWRGEEQWGRRRGSSLLTEKMTYVTPDTPTATDPPLSSLTHTSALNTVRLQEGKCPFSGCRTARHIYSIRTPQPVKSFPSQKETNPLLNSALGTKIQLNH